VDEARCGLVCCLFWRRAWWRVECGSGRVLSAGAVENRTSWSGVGMCGYVIFGLRGV
jgi:hypothetical protein